MDYARYYLMLLTKSQEIPNIHENITYQITLGAFFLLVWWFLIIALVVILVCNWIIFSKFYKEPGWKSLIPFYSSWIQSKHTFGENYAWLGLLISLIYFAISWLPFINLLGVIGLIWYEWEVVSRLHKSTGVKLLALLVPIIGYPIIAFSQGSEYTGAMPPFWDKKKENIEQKENIE